MEKYVSLVMLMASAIITLFTGTPSGAANEKAGQHMRGVHALCSRTSLLGDELVAQHGLGELLRLLGGLAQMHTALEAIVKGALAASARVHLRLDHELLRAQRRSDIHGLGGILDNTELLHCHVVLEAPVSARSALAASSLPTPWARS